MKVKASLKLACADCYYVRRGKRLYIRCSTNPRHKRRQGFSTLVQRPAMVQQQQQFSLNMPVIGECTHCSKPVQGPLALHEVMAVRMAWEKKD